MEERRMLGRLAREMKGVIDKYPTVASELSK